jgi:hypothetical protein
VKFGEHTLRACENRVVRRLCALRGRMRQEEHFRVIKSRAKHVAFAEEMTYVCTVLVKKSEGKKPPGRSKSRWMMFFL